MRSAFSWLTEHRVGVPRAGIAAAACVAFCVMSAEVAEAKSFFCKPAPINIGSYRPEDSSSELDISVNFPDASPFWFDDETGDYVSLNDGVVGPIVKKIVHLPLTLTNPKDKLTNAAVVAFAAGQCLPAEMGVFKQAPWP